jgi:hypothetical protein
MESEVEKNFIRIYAAVYDALQRIPIPSEEIYVGGFWLFYCDYTVLGAPCLAFNSGGSDIEARWSPSEWQVDVDDTVAEVLNPLYIELTKFMEGRSDEDWEFLIEYQYSYYCAISLALTKEKEKVFSGWNLADDFVVGVFEERESEEIYSALVKASISEDLVGRLGILRDS